MLAWILCSYETQAFQIGSIVFVNVSEAKVSSRQYPKAKELAWQLDDDVAQIVGQTINSHNHSKWIIQSLHNASFKLKIKEQHLSIRLMPVITIHDASFLTDFETHQLLLSLREPLRSDSALKWSMYFGHESILQRFIQIDRTCLPWIMSLMNLESILITITEAHELEIGSLNVVISNQMKRINITELNDRVNVFTPSSIHVHSSIRFHYMKCTRTPVFGIEACAQWRKLSLHARDKLIVLGYDSYSYGWDRIITSHFCGYVTAYQAAQEAERILNDTNCSMAAIRRLFEIKTSWMNGVYDQIMKKSDIDRDQIKVVKSAHNGLHTTLNATAQMFHRLHVEHESEEFEEGAEILIVENYLALLEEKEREMSKELKNIKKTQRIAIVEEVIKTIDRKFKIYLKCKGFKGPLYIVRAEEILREFMDHRDNFDTLHVVTYYKRSEDFERMERLITEMRSNQTRAQFV